MGYKRKARILFLGMHHACRAPMAEGLANALGDGWIEARAAGLDPQPLDPLAVAAMAEAGIILADHRSPLTADLLRWADLVVTLDAAARDRCPPLPSGVQHRHYPFAIPADGLPSYRALREQIRVRVAGMIGGMKMLQRDSE